MAARSGNAKNVSAFVRRHRPDHAALHEIPQVILAQRAVARPAVAHRVILTLQRLGTSARRRAGRTPSSVRISICDARVRRSVLRRASVSGSSRVTRRRPWTPRLPTRFAGLESFGANHQHRRLRVDVVGCGAAETRHERARVLAAERAEFSGEDNELSRECLVFGQVRRGSGQTASASIEALQNGHQSPR